MHMMLDALRHALADCFRPRVIVWSLFPLLLLAAMAALVGVFWWESATASMQAWLVQARSLQWLWSWLGQGSVPSVSGMAAAILMVLLLSPVLIVLTLAVLGVVLMPQMVALVAQSRFAHLQRLDGASWWVSVWCSLRCTALALLVLVLTLPLWLVPPLVLVLPPLIWGWLTYRVMSFDALAEHASATERQRIVVQHRSQLMLMGLLCGYLGAAPGVVWASGLVFAAAFWILIPLAVWIYALVFAFSALWFTHYALAALHEMRKVP